MSKTASREGITVAIPVHNSADRIERFVTQWADGLARLGCEYEIIAVNDGSTDATRETLEKLTAGRVKNLTVLNHDAKKGFGACVREAVQQAKQPLFFYTSPDYPYSPQDLPKLLERIEIRDAILKKQPDLISGCRTGQATPSLFDGIGKAWRFFCRVILGLQLEPPPAWLGVGGTMYRIFTKFTFGVPLADVNSQYKLFRTAFLRRFPIQSDSDFVHTELVAKATFLTSIMDEVPLSPVDAPPPSASVWGDFWRVFQNPDFGNPMPQAPAAPPPAAVVETKPAEPAPAPEPPNPPTSLAFA